jgi:hypothetical protein
MLKPGQSLGQLAASVANSFHFWAFTSRAGALPQTLNAKSDISGFAKWRLKMSNPNNPNQNQNPGQQQSNPRPGQQQGGGQRPDQQQQGGHKPDQPGQQQKPGQGGQDR